MTIDSKYYARSLKILDKNLISGSVDRLRTALDAGWVKTSDGTQTTSEYVPKSFERQYVGEIYGGPSGVGEITPTNDYIHFFTRHTFGNDVLRDVRFSSKTPLPIIKYPIRLYGDNATIYSDLHWQKYLAGGTYNEQEYEGIFTDSEYTDHWFNFLLSYNPIQVKQADPESPEKYRQLDISYDYNQYFKSYEQANSDLPSVRLIPNAYMLQSLSYADEKYTSSDSLVGMEAYANSVYGINTINYVSREGKFGFGDYSSLLFSDEQQKTMYSLALEAGVRVRRSVFEGVAGVKSRKFFQYYYPLHSIKSTTSDYIDNKFKNVLMDHKFIKNDYQTLYQNRERIPYYSKIALPPHGAGEMGKVIEEADASSKFLLTLKEMFVDNSLTTKPTSNVFAVQETGHLNAPLETNETYDLNVKLVDMGDFVTEMRNNYISQNYDFCCLGDPEELSRAALYNTKGDYRYFNTISATDLLTSFINKFDSDSFLEKIKLPYAESSITEKEHETLAYRIEKIGGAGEGDDRTQNVLQNFYIFNTNDGGDAKFIDSQVKYGEQYTYNIYAYVLVSGYRYQASGLRVTRTIGDISRPEDDYNVYCLEFFDPLTGERKDKLVKASLGAGERELDNTFSSEAQIASYNYKYLADFNVSIQPSIQLVEIPIGTNNVRIMDHPVNIAHMLPFSIKNSSQEVGFNVRYSEFENLPYPETLTLDEELLKQNYLESNKLFVQDNLDKQSVSRARYLEVYRLDEMPTDYKQFEGNRVYFSDLASIVRTEPAIDDDGVPQPIDANWWKVYDTPTFTTDFFVDQIDTNKQYYYAARFLNERLEPGHFSPIYLVKLIDDGGYKYTVFDVLYRYQLKQDTVVNPMKSFKKLINVVPAFQHLYFDDSEVDYTKSAFSQKENIEVGFAADKIWNKRFKIRLTSKKTGKKIDLNITYKLSR